MNCPQCQTANAPGAAFCGNCGAQLAVAEPAGAPVGYGPPQGTGAPPSYEAPAGYNNAPGGYNNAPGGYNNAPGGYNNAPGGYSNPGTPQQPGYPQGQYQPPAGGGYTPGSTGSGVPPVSFDLNRATTVDKVVAVATFIAMISIWLPWVSVSAGGFSGSASGTAVHGWLWLEFLLAIVLIAYLVARVAWDKLPFGQPVAHERVLIVGTAVQLLLVLIAFFDIPSGGYGVSVGWDFGAFLGLLAALVAGGPVLVPAVRSYLESRKAR
jgi:Double zinc ribbon